MSALWIPSFDVNMDKDVKYRNVPINTEWFRDTVMREIVEQVFDVNDDNGYTHSISYNEEEDVFKVVFKYDSDIELPLTIAKPFFDKFMAEELTEYLGVQKDTNPFELEGFVLIYKKL
jgi:hypothetical protein